jgi:hypothetical protein
MSMHSKAAIWLLVLLSQALAQVPVLEVYPTVACLKSDPPPSCKKPIVFPWFRLSDLADELQVQGISYQQNTQHQLLLPGGKAMTFARRTNPQGVVDGYIDAGELMQQLGQTDLQLRLEGWRNPRLWLGQASVVFGTEQAATDAYGFYLWWLLRIAHSAFPGPGLSFHVGNDPRYAPIPGNAYVAKVVKGQAGEVYGLIARQTGDRAAKVFLDLALVLPDGKAQLYLPKTAQRWVGSLKELAAQKDAVMLVRLGGRATADQPEYRIVWPLP